MAQAIVQSEHEVAALQFLRRPLAAHDQQSSGPMPWQSRGTQPETELLAVGTAKGALHVFDWQGRLLLDLPQATPGMALLVSPAPAPGSFPCLLQHLEHAAVKG